MDSAAAPQPKRAALGDVLTSGGTTHRDLLLTAMERARMSELFGSVTLVVDGCTLRLHKAVAVAFSDTLRASLTGGQWAEGQAEHTRIQLHEDSGMDAASLRAIVDWMCSCVCRRRAAPTEPCADPQIDRSMQTPASYA